LRFFRVASSCAATACDAVRLFIDPFYPLFIDPHLFIPHLLITPFIYSSHISFVDLHICLSVIRLFISYLFHIYFTVHVHQ